VILSKVKDFPTLKTMSKGNSSLFLFFFSTQKKSDALVTDIILVFALIFLSSIFPKHLCDIIYVSIHFLKSCISVNTMFSPFPH